MGDMSIAALSVDLHAAKAEQDLGVAVMKMAMDDTADMAEVVTDMASLDPAVGTNVDILA